MTVLKLYPNVIRCEGLHLRGKRAIVYSEHANIVKRKGTVLPLVHPCVQFLVQMGQEVQKEVAMHTSILVNIAHCQLKPDAPGQVRLRLHLFNTYRYIYQNIEASFDSRNIMLLILNYVKVFNYLLSKCSNWIFPIIFLKRIPLKNCIPPFPGKVNTA